MEIRKIVTVVEETHREGEKTVAKPTRKAVAMAVIKNPFAGQYVEDLTELMEIGEQLGSMLAERAVKVLGIAKEDVESYGKGVIVGEKGELEHAAAILHPRLGKPFREQVGGGKAIIPSAKKLGGMGTSLDVPVHYKDAAFVRTHYDAMEVRIADAPRADELLVALVVTDSGRPHPRIGGLQKNEIEGEDGLR
ncbi:amino acid synthesis family protein [Desulfosporosinus fructosivorans]|uniref:Amino acid synthesis family protein n=1 Tax=Desulfosporosinus fructosivorans TaxID=2018669 RepID=A0A4Z0R6P0_9FIRM|nr:amino acid synthesis family protein [Desulfosporosinus fructosivorans]TGE38059.1 amino acid synthesis family protein [Desulfosporosinus fructosivorans]